MSPLIIAVAPNGARKTKEDHVNLPIQPEELAREAEACLAAGAAMIHLHVRREDNRHSLDLGRYRAAIAAIRDRVGQQIIIQATSEAVGMYSSDEQMDIIRQLQPEALQSEVQIGDPHVSSDNRNNLSIIFSIFEPLINYGDHGGFSPALAERWEVSPDARTWIFHLRHPVSLHNGGLLRAQDVVDSL